MISTNEYRKSSFSGGGECVEVRLLENGEIGVRDSKNPATPPLVFTQPEWRAFLNGVRDHQFDLPEGPS